MKNGVKVGADEIRLHNLHPMQKLSHVLTENPDAKRFKLSWLRVLGPFRESTVALYDRDKKTLHLHYDENNIGIRRNVVYAPVTDAILHRLVRLVTRDERRKHIMVSPADFFAYLTQLGCRKIKLP